jgi:hypothetical protein
LNTHSSLEWGGPYQLIETMVGRPTPIADAQAHLGVASVASAVDEGPLPVHDANATRLSLQYRVVLQSEWHGSRRATASVKVYIAPGAPSRRIEIAFAGESVNAPRLGSAMAPVSADSRVGEIWRQPSPPRRRVYRKASRPRPEAIPVSGIPVSVASRNRASIPAIRFTPRAGPDQSLDVRITC